MTIVKGAGDYAAAADRLTTILKPWGVNCTVVNAADMKMRQLDDETLKTWAPPYGGYRFNPKEANPTIVGYDLPGSAILLGTPEDNPLIKWMRDQPQGGTLLPYQPKKDSFPGRGRGYISWQRDAIHFDGEESVTLIAYDAAGMSEAIGTLYEMTAGLNALTPLTTPDGAALTAATTPTHLPALPVAWQITLPDRAVQLSADGDTVQALTLDGSQAVIAGGKLKEQKDVAPPAMPKPTAPVIPDALKGKLAPMRLPKLVATANGVTAVAYWGGTLQIFNADATLKAQQQLPQDITALAWSNNTLVAGLADGRVMGLGGK